ncbi:ABC transporter permease [Sphaerisporangium sp. NPDC051017]|uniref:ABC transporter permease n=1 Tax=unclassified Sphaerisporangium TaxID=2630420 RepID=UPI0033DEEB33
MTAAVGSPATSGIATRPRTGLPAWVGRTFQLAPALVWIAVLVLVPNLFLLLYSFWTSSYGVVVPELTTANYTALFSSEVFWILLRRTLVIALVSAALATVIAYAAAYVIVRRFGRYKLLAALLILIPLWVSYLMRVFAWKIILGDNGFLAGVLRTLGFGPDATSLFLYSQTSMIITLTYVAIPYAFLSTYTALERVPPHLLEAAADCGAGAWTRFRTVILPLTRPGAAVGFAIAFVLVFGDYVTPAMVGGLDGTMLGTLVLQQFGPGSDWAGGSAVGITIIATGLLLLAVISLFTRLEARLD